MGSQHASRQDATRACQKLRGEWLAASGQWPEGVHRRFVREHWQVIDFTVLDYAENLEALAGVIDPTRRNVNSLSRFHWAGVGTQHCPTSRARAP
ncbi:MAG TPA: hypothetical protein VMY98_03980 [Anaerolineae bacterium]|nr:hypothetical protein [Anaerolineae bacterium]